MTDNTLTKPAGDKIASATGACKVWNAVTMRRIFGFQSIWID
jgi:hypothetical protein